jgi:hypothetical protein
VFSDRPYKTVSLFRQSILCPSHTRSSHIPIRSDKPKQLIYRDAPVTATAAASRAQTPLGTPESVTRTHSRIFKVDEAGVDDEPGVQAGGRRGAVLIPCFLTFLVSLFLTFSLSHSLTLTLTHTHTLSLTLSLSL